MSDPDGTDPTPGGWQPPPPPPPPPPPSYGTSDPPPYAGAGYQQPAYGQQQPGAAGGYGQAPYGYQPYAAPPQTEGTAVGALVASILSFVLCPVIPAIVALVMIPGARRKIADSHGRLTGESLLTAAKWISIIHLALFVLAILAFVVLIAVGTATSSSDVGNDFSLGTLLGGALAA